MPKNIYSLRARVFPALITSIPMLIFLNKILVSIYPAAFKNVFDVLSIIEHLGLSAAIIFLFVQINRIAAKEIFERMYFGGDLYMPSTNHLLLKNEYYNNVFKNKIRNKINLKFNISLLSEKQEVQNETEARKLIAGSVSQIRIALKDNRMLLQHNIEYGFWRNIIGGSIIAVLFSIGICLYGWDANLASTKTIGVICSIIYALPLLFSKLIITKYGNYYSKILYEQFLGLN